MRPADTCARARSPIAHREPGIASAPGSESESRSPSPTPPVTPLPILNARLEILRLLTLLVSLPSLLTPAGLFPTTRNRWRDALVSGRVVGRPRGRDKKVVLALLCSVLNTALAEGIRAAHGVIPAAHSFAGGFEGLKERASRLAAETARRTTEAATGSGGAARAGLWAAGQQQQQQSGHDAGTDSPAGARVALVEACLQFLNVVLIEHQKDDDDTRSSSSENQFAYYVARLHRPADFDRLANGLVGFLVAALMTSDAAPGSTGWLGSLAGALSPSSPSTAAPPSLPHTPARRSVPRGATEALVVLARLVETNRKWVPHLAAQDPALLVRVLVAVEASLVDWARDGDPNLLGPVRLASIVMQQLTARVASSASATAADGLVRALNAPLEPRVVGPALAAVVRRQMAEQAVAGTVEVAAAAGKAEPAQVVTFSEYLVVSVTSKSSFGLPVIRVDAAPTQISLHALVLPADRQSPAASASYRAAVSTLYPSLLLAVTNLSPLVRELEHDAATRFARVWLAFSAPSWVLMEEGNPRLVFCEYCGPHWVCRLSCGRCLVDLGISSDLLEAFNNIAQYNLDRVRPVRFPPV